jgi:phage shock protein PspC (stress-responsive transcriptional regulator)
MHGMDDHAATTTEPTPTPPPAPPAGERRLVRRVDRRWLGGVCAGLGEHFDVDPIVFRLGFIALSLFGVGIVIYILAWILIPAADGPPPPRSSNARPSSVDRARSQITGFPALAGLLILIVGLALIGRGIGLASGIVWGLALVTLGVLLFRPKDPPPASPPGPSSAASAPPARVDVAPLPPPPASGPVEPETGAEGIETGADVGLASAVETAEVRIVSDDRAPTTGAQPEAWSQAEWVASDPSAGRTDTAAQPVAPLAAPAVRRRKSRSALGWIAFGTSLVAVGAAVLLQQNNAVDLRPDQIAAIGLLVLGAGLVVGAWIGRARWLIVFGILAIPVVLAASLVDVPVEGGAGDRTYVPVAAADVPDAYRLAAGHLTLDLRAWDPTSRGTVVATLAAGYLEVILPPDLSVVLHARAGAGAVDVYGQTRGGFGVEVDRTLPGTGAGSTGTVELDVEASFGLVSIHRADRLVALGPPGSPGPSAIAPSSATIPSALAEAA